jgi:NADH:ubiquinone oxidoreductase subunit 2 (subunit N)
MTLNSKSKKGQLFLSKIMFFAWLIAVLACLIIGIMDYNQNGNENTLQYFLFFCVSALMAIYRLALMKRMAKQLEDSF